MPASLPLPAPQPESVESSQSNYLLGEGGFTLEILYRVWSEDWQECEPILRAATEGQFRKRDGSGEAGEDGRLAFRGPRSSSRSQTLPLINFSIRVSVSPSDAPLTPPTLTQPILYALKANGLPFRFFKPKICRVGRTYNRVCWRKRRRKPFTRQNCPIFRRRDAAREKAQNEEDIVASQCAAS